MHEANQKFVGIASGCLRWPDESNVLPPHEDKKGGISTFLERDRDQGTED